MAVGGAQPAQCRSRRVPGQQTPGLPGTGNVPGRPGLVPVRAPGDGARRRRSDGDLGAVAGSRRVGHDRAGVRAAEPRDIGRAVLGVLAERPLGHAGQDVAEVPDAGSAWRSGAREALGVVETPERIELRAQWLHVAVVAGDDVAQELRRRHVRLELDLRIEIPRLVEWAYVPERGRLVGRPVRPGARPVVGSVEVQVSVLEQVVDAEGDRRMLLPRLAVDQHGAVALLEAGTVGELAVLAAARIVTRAGDRAGCALRSRVRADAGVGIARALANRMPALRAAHAGLEHLLVDEAA